MSRRGPWDRRRVVESVVVVGVVTTGVILRLWGIDFGLPCTYCRPDESTLVHKALGVASGDFNPHFFNYPSLQFYLLAGAYGCYYGVGWIAGWFETPVDVARSFFQDPTPYYLIARVFSALAGAATVVVTWCLGRRIGRRAGGVFSALFLALAYLHVRDSHFATVDVPATLLAVSSLYAAVLYLGSGELRTLLASGLLLGMAASTKYSALLFFAGLAAAILLSSNHWRIGARRLAACGLAMIFGFLAGTPYALLDASAFWQGIAFERLHYVTGHAATTMDEGSCFHYLWFVLRYGLGAPLLAFALLGGIRALWRHRPVDVVILAAFGGYFLILSMGRTGFARYAIPVVPLLCVWGGEVMAALWRRHQAMAILVAVAVTFPSFARSIACDRLLDRTDTRVLAAQWLERSVPDGACIAMLGSDYGFPNVRRSRPWLMDALERVRKGGGRGARLTTMLSLPGWPPPPSYYILQVLPAQRHPELKEGWLARLRSAGVDWLVTHDYPLPYSENSQIGQLGVGAAVTLAHLVDPGTQAFSMGKFDRFDAFYLPYAGLGAVTRPGPRIRIYRLTSPAVP